MTASAAADSAPLLGTLEPPDPIPHMDGPNSRTEETETMGQRAKVATIEDRERAQRALELRRRGTTYAEIAQQIGWTDESGPRKAVSRLLARIDAEGVAELREVESQRLDALQSAVWDDALKGDFDAVNTVLKISARRARLLGLDMPQQVRLDPAALTEAEFAKQFVGLLADLGDDGIRQVLNEIPGRPWEILRTPEPLTVEVVEDTAAEQQGATTDPAASPFHLAAVPGGDYDGWSNL